MTIFLEVMLVIFTIAITLVAIVGEILPGLPGSVLVWVFALGYGVVTNWERVSWWTILLLTIIWLVIVIVDNFGQWILMKKLGATWTGLGISILGTIIGFFVFGFVGSIIGMLIGSLVGELLATHDGWQAIKSTFLGGVSMVANNAVRLMLIVVMSAIFVVDYMVH